MGCLIKWKSIDSDATYDKARIYRATSESGTYSIIATQSITDQSYYDIDGTVNLWYKIDFYDTNLGKASSLSDAIRGGTYKAYCTVEDIRNITNLTVNDATDTQLANLIEYCGAQLNGDIQVYLEEEQIVWISDTKDNTINGTNRIFYTKKYPVGDLDNDMDVDVNDIEVYQYESDGTKTQVSVESIIPNTGQFVLTTAPASSIITLAVTYKYAPVSVSDPNMLVKMACALLTAAWAYTKINVGKAPRWRMGSTQIWRDMDSFKTFFNKYQLILTQINNRSLLDTVQGMTQIDAQYIASLGGYSGVQQ